MEGRELRREISKFQKRTRCSQIEIARAAGLDRSKLNQFLVGHGSFTADEIRAVEAAISKLARRRLRETLAAMLPKGAA